MCSERPSFALAQHDGDVHTWYSSRSLRICCIRIASWGVLGLHGRTVRRQEKRHLLGHGRVATAVSEISPPLYKYTAVELFCWTTSFVRDIP